MYNSLLNHPTSTLTPLSILYMLLLAIQTSIQPRISRKYIPKKISNVKVALVEEVIKTSVASLLFWKWTPKHILQQALQDWTLSSSLLVAGIPATLYAIQGVLTYLSHQHLDSVTFNGLSQTKTLTAAFCCYLVMGKRQSPFQILALALLFLSAFVFQNTITFGIPVNQKQNHKTSSTTNNPDPSFLLYGVAPCLAATFLSGLAGAFSQRGLQIVGGSGRNPFLYTVEVSFFSALALLASESISLLTTPRTASNNDIAALTTMGPKPISTNEDVSTSTTATSTTPTTRWTWQTLIPITCKAMGGILTALVHKHAGSVVKGFALMLGLVMSGILQSLWTENMDANGNKIPSRLPIHQVLGIVIVMFSSWLHFTNPPSS
jgi:solute carrier family 35 (UDP-sugar transporter), member A1/2/3